MSHLGIGRNNPMSKLLPVLSFLFLFLFGCLGRSGSAPLPENFTPASSLTATQTLIPSTLTATAIPTSTVTMSPTSTPEPVGCQKPPQDYTRVEVNGWTFNQRTLAMLAHAQKM